MEFPRKMATCTLVRSCRKAARRVVSKVQGSRKTVQRGRGEVRDSDERNQRIVRGIVLTEEAVARSSFTSLGFYTFQGHSTAGLRH